MTRRILAVIAGALIAAGVIVIINASDRAPALTMLDGSGHR